jgi:hypothetical protein
MGMLLQGTDSNTQTIILLDEPETSLHADAQHQLRRVFEALAEQPNIQVVYATHSPSMLNSRFPNRIRVLYRTTEQDRAISKSAKVSFGENFQQVRASWGITPSDSLLYGAVTVLVEGSTEVRCLGTILTKLSNSGTAGFEAVAADLESCAFVCGWGDNIINYCRIAQSQGAQPIAFLDGDKAELAEKMRALRPPVPVVMLGDRTEFEDLVPAERYILAVAAEFDGLGIDSSGITFAAFETWKAISPIRTRLMFSKLVERWTEDVASRSFNKHAVMERAIEMTPAGEIGVAQLRELTKIIRATLS